MTISKVILSLILLTAFCAAVEPYAPRLNDPMSEPWRWRSEEALDDLSVLCMDEAEDGSLWFGCVGGIARYDGVEVRSIPFDAEQLDKLTTTKDVPWAKALLALRDGRLLVLVGNSLVLWDESAWTVVLRDVGESTFSARLTESADGAVWLGVPEGLWRIRADLSEAKLALNAPEQGRLAAFCLDLSGNAWVVEQRVEGGTRLIELLAENAWSTSGGRAFDVPFHYYGAESCIGARGDGSIVYGVSRRETGLLTLDPEAGQWRPLDSDPPSHTAFYLTEGRAGKLWVGFNGRIASVTEERGVVMYSEPKSTLPQVPLRLFEARNGRLWVMGRIGYVHSVDLGMDEWTTYEGLNFECETEAGAHWFRTSDHGSVVAYDSNTDAWTRYGADDGLLDKVYELGSTSHGWVWASGQHEGRAAIAVFDGARWTRFAYPEFAVMIRSGAGFESMDGSVWFGAAGILLPDSERAGGALRFQVNANGEVELLKRYAPPLLPYYVSAFAETPERTLWLGSTVVHALDLDTLEVERYPELQGENVVAMAVGEDQSLWLAKEHFGVCRRVEDGWRIYTTKDGLAGLKLIDLIALEDGSLLTSSDQGISRFDGRGWTRHAYPEWFRMSSRWSGLRQASDGAVWLNFAENEPRVGEGDSVGNGLRAVRHQAEKDPPDTWFVSHVDKVSSLGTTHVAWSGRDPWSRTPRNELRYSWRLNEGEWSAFSPAESHTFTDLEAGRHTLEVRARDQAFNVDESPARVVFEVIPPVWRQGWFVALITGFTCAIIGLIWIIIRNRERHLLTRQREREAALVQRQREREAHLQEVDRLKTGFFTNISHELRTPLTVVIGRLEGLWEAEKDEQQKRSIAAVMRNARRMGNLVTQLLDFRKLEEGKLSVETTQGDLIPAMREWMASLELLAEEKGITCELETPEACVGSFDFDKFEKIFTNLVSNAIKYTEADGSVRVRVSGLSEERMELVVDDTGEGISPEHLKHIFDRFYRVSEASLAVGAGIGLNLTKELVDLLEGTIRAESPIHADSAHPGTRFVVELPFSGEEPKVARESAVVAETEDDATTVPSVEETEEESDSSVSVAEGRPVVLVVEDDEDIRSFVVDGLKSLYQVETAGNGEVGLRRAKELVPDLVITDLMMPLMDGAALCEALKSEWETSHVPVVMLTAKAALDSQVAGLKSGADDYVTKPFHMELLLARVANLLESRRLLREKFSRDVPLVSANLPENTLDREFLEKAVSELEEHGLELEYKPDDFAAALHMSRSTLQRKLKAVADKTPQAFINEFRMQRASELLLGTTLTIAEIAFQVGYDEPTNFTRRFKTYARKTPSRFREDHQSR